MEFIPGLAVLYESLLGLGDVTVIAPDRDRSAASNSLTLSTPIRVRELENGFYSVDGTPADCVYVGLRALLKQQPKMIVSGINSGEIWAMTYSILVLSLQLWKEDF